MSFRSNVMSIDRRAVFEQNTSMWKELLRTVCSQHGTNVMSIDWKSVQMIVRLCGRHACSTCEHFAGTCSEVQTRWKVATNVINNKHSI